MKRIICGAMAVTMLAVVSCKPKEIDLKSEEDKTLYSVGAMFGERLSNMKLSDAQVEAIVAGVRESAAGKASRVNVQEYAPKVRDFFNDRMKVMAEDNKKSGTTFIDNFVAKEGATKTESGLAFKIIKEGTGAYPKAEDTVRVHYHGTLTDGTVFDSSVERGQPVNFPLNRVIPGWTEGLQKVKAGGKIKLVIPSQLAYGDAGAPPKIPGGSTLIFDVELLEIVKNETPVEAPKGKKK
ncbi:MAG: FKBP-type peptidyl-prolyl cis-trans isomerase [Bdellovibrio sp.]